MVTNKQDKMIKKQDVMIDKQVKPSARSED